MGSIQPHATSFFVPVCAEKCHLLLPGFSLVAGADQGSEQKVTLQSYYQPARWVQYVQITASGGAVCCYDSNVYQLGLT